MSVNRISVFLFIIFSWTFTQDTAGCTDIVALNYNPNADLDDGSCEYDLDQWFVTPGLFQFDGGMTAAVMMDGARTTDPEDILAGFVGNECRGVSFGLVIPNTDEMVFMLMLYSNDAAGEEIGFRYYDHSTGIVHVIIDTILFQSDMILGSPLNPFIFEVAPLVIDCEGTVNGSASLDDCGICSGGTTGHLANSDQDYCGICFGENECPGDGDMNEDGFLDILDVVRTVSIIMGQAIASEYENWSGDTNDDGAVDILDIIVMMTAILSTEDRDE